MKEVRVLEREEARGREKRKNEIYDLLYPSFYAVLPSPILEVHDTLRNGRATRSSDLHAKAKLNSPAIALIQRHTQSYPGSQMLLPFSLSSRQGIQCFHGLMRQTTQGHSCYTEGGGRQCFQRSHFNNGTVPLFSLQSALPTQNMETFASVAKVC